MYLKVFLFELVASFSSHAFSIWTFKKKKEAVEGAIKA